MRGFLLLGTGCVTSLLLVGCARPPAAQAAPARTLPAAPPGESTAIPVRQVTLPLSPRYPVWLQAGGRRTDQTSGFTFVERSADDALLFFSCDDIGALHRIEIRESQRPDTGTTGEGWITLAPIAIPDTLRDRFGVGTAKLDLEETAWAAPATPGGAPTALLSVEGNASAAEMAQDPRAHEVRNELVWVEFDAPFATATRLSSVEPFLQAIVQPAWDAGWESPWEGHAARSSLPLAGMKPNRGFEGVAIGGPRARQGLPAIQAELWFGPEEPWPASPLVPPLWQGRLPIFHQVQRAGAAEPTMRVQFLPPACTPMSLCGLYLLPDGSALFVLDRNLQRIHRVRLAADGTFSAVDTAQLSLPGPSGEPYFTPSLESLTVDDAGALWTVVDPWKYTPLPGDDLVLSPEEVERYRQLVPLLYRYEPWPK